jgi:hypothetical protein
VTVELTATPAAGAVFSGWGGACSGTTTTCTVEMTAARSVTAAFRTVRRPSGTKATGAVLRSAGRPVVRRTAVGFRVTLRFTTLQRGTAHVRALRAGRTETALAFRVAVGTATVGPFPVSKPGFYRFELRLGTRSIHWTACLGRCGAAAHAAPFVLTREPVKAVRAGVVWSLTIRFHATQPAGARLRIFRGKRLAKDYRFAPPAGVVSAGPFLLSPGTYSLRLTATDAYGRVKALSWFAFLP